MFQQFTPVYSYFEKVGKSAQPLAKMWLALMAIFWLSSLHAKPICSDGLMLSSGAALASDTTLEARICSGESYLFDGQLLNASGEYVATYVAADGSDSTVTLQLTVLPLSSSSLDALICEGETYLFNEQLLDQTGTYAFIVPGANGCDSTVTLHLQVLPPISTNFKAGICEGTAYIFQGDTLTESGLYSIVLTSSSGCDSIVSLDLTVAPFFETPLQASICPGATYEFAGTELTDAGIYTDTLTAIGGCDSILVLSLSIRPTSTTLLQHTMCIGASYDFYGTTLTDSGSYEALFSGSNGCDSIVILKLEVVDSYDVQLEGTICAGEFFYFDGDLLDTEGVYTYPYVAQGGCDSTVTFTLHVLEASTGAGSATICYGDAYDFNGELLTAEGIYTFVLEAANGCDSVFSFSLNVLPAIGTSLEAVICAGDTYVFNGESLADAGSYSAIYTAENGCDSTVTLTLTVLPVQQTNLSASICEGGAFEYNGEMLTDGGTYTFVYIGENGCDSTVTLTLTVFPAQSSSLSVRICEGDAYEFDGVLIADAGTYSAVFTSINGCDSTVTLELSILPLQETTLEATICANQTYAFNGETLNMAGVYTAVLTGSNGCDSTVVLTLNVLPTQNESIEATICEGTSYDYNGNLLTDAGDFEFVFEGENGCDSTVTVRITVLPVAKTSIDATICAGDAYDYNGEALTDAGNYDFAFPGANGCDSVVTVHLDVLPLLTSNTGVALCEGSAYVFNGDTLTVSGIYEYVFSGSNGCDSTATLVLEFVSSFETNLQASVCAGGSYVFGNDTLTASGEYSLLLTAQGGCDSLVNLSFSVLPLSQSTSQVLICEGQSYDFNGQVLNASGTYSALLTGANGCDSTAWLELTVLPTLSATLEATICSNETYPFNGGVLSDAGVYTAVLSGSNGCDSTVVLTLNVLPIQGSSRSVSICANETYDFEGEILSQSGFYVATLEGTNGCDSIVALNLEVLPLAQSAFAVSVCNGATFEYDGTVFTESGTYELAYPGAAANGCDSIATLYLTIFPAIPPTSISASICDGDSYDFFGSTLTVPGTYTADLSSSVGCDSTIVLSLSVNPTPFTNLSATICAGESYPFNGQSLSQAGVYFAVLQTAAGCDSTIILTLNVNTVNTNVTLQGGTIISSATDGTFQWINCSTNQIVPGATGNFFAPSVTGSYAVVVTQAGCTATSTCVFVQVVSTSEPLTAHEWTLQPNPTAAATQLVFQSPSAEHMWLEIYDLAGRLLQRQWVVAGTKQIDLDLTELPDGILMVRLATKQGVSTKRLLKAH